MLHPLLHLLHPLFHVLHVGTGATPAPQRHRQPVQGKGTRLAVFGRFASLITNSRRAEHGGVRGLERCGWIQGTCAVHCNN